MHDGYRDDNDNYARRSSKHSFKQYIEDIRLQEALDESEEDFDLDLEDIE